MTWPLYRDGGFSGPIAKMFGVRAIPHTFNVDATACFRMNTSAMPRSKAS